MSLKSILSERTSFTGEFPVSPETRLLWRFNSEGDSFSDATTNGNHLKAMNWTVSSSAALPHGRYGNYCRINIQDPAAEKTYLIAENDGSIFAGLGDRIAVGGWINPTTYSVGNTYCPIFNA